MTPVKITDRVHRPREPPSARSIQLTRAIVKVVPASPRAGARPMSVEHRVRVVRFIIHIPYSTLLHLKM